MRRRSRAAALVAALAPALAGGCVRRDVDTTPFHLTATTQSGASLAEGITIQAELDLHGAAHVPDPTTLVVDDGVRGPITFRFDPKGLPELAFPARLEGQLVEAQVFIDPTATGAFDEPLPFPGLRIATVPLVPTFEFVLWEGTYALPNSVASPPHGFQQVLGSEDIPVVSIAADHLVYEPARCGPVYEDVAVVEGGGATLTLRAGERASLLVGIREDPWTIVHVGSWHRHGTCSGQSGTWTQVAAWR